MSMSIYERAKHQQSERARKLESLRKELLARDDCTFRPKTTTTASSSLTTLHKNRTQKKHSDTTRKEETVFERLYYHRRGKTCTTTRSGGNNSRQFSSPSPSSSLVLVARQPRRRSNTTTTDRNGESVFERLYQKRRRTFTGIMMRAAVAHPSDQPKQRSNNETTTTTHSAKSNSPARTTTAAATATAVMSISPRLETLYEKGVRKLLKRPKNDRMEKELRDCRYEERELARAALLYNDGKTRTQRTVTNNNKIKKKKMTNGFYSHLEDESKAEKPLLLSSATMPFKRFYYPLEICLRLNSATVPSSSRALLNEQQKSTGRRDGRLSTHHNKNHCEYKTPWHHHEHTLHQDGSLVNVDDTASTTKTTTGSMMMIQDIYSDSTIVTTDEQWKHLTDGSYSSLADADARSQQTEYGSI